MKTGTGSTTACTFVLPKTQSVVAGVASFLGNLNRACATACDAFAKDVEFSGKTLLARAGWLIDRQQAVLHPPNFSGKLGNASRSPNETTERGHFDLTLALRFRVLNCPRIDAKERESVCVAGTVFGSEGVRCAYWRLVSVAEWLA
jgi:hypothetical protein